MLVPEFYRVILFLFLCGITVPSFGTFGYFFMLDVVKFSKFTIAMLSFVGYICLMIGSAMYTKFFANKGIHKLFVISCLIGVVSAPFYLLFVTR